MDGIDAIALKTKWGVVTVEIGARGIRRVLLGRAPASGRPAATRLTRKLAEEFRRYAGGQPVKWRVPLDLAGGTAFQRQVWRALQAIPHGETRSYAWVARKIGRPKAARAVGAACGANPIPIIIPCHRVVASDGSLGGYSGGRHWKRRLLQLEAR